jgi:hypothetical protein
LGSAQVPVRDFEVFDSVPAQSVPAWTNARILHN